MTTPLPPRLAAALHRGHAEKDVWPLVRQLELYGLQVAVRRIQLGDMRSAEFCTAKEIYRTREESKPDEAGNGL